MRQLVRSVYLDTNIFVSAVEAGVHSRPSLNLIRFLRARRLAVIGSALLRQEIVRVQGRLRMSGALELYWDTTVLEMPASREVRRLGLRYTSALGLKPSDAQHLAYATVLGTDAFLSWNKQDLIRPKTIHGVRVANAALGLSTPTILAPPDFLGRARPSNRLGRIILD